MDAPAEIIKASYRTCMQKLRAHPDLGGDNWNAALLNEALAVLSSPEKRQRYDRELADKQTFKRDVADIETKTTVAENYPETMSGSAGMPEPCLFCGAPPAGLDIPECLRCQSPLTRLVSDSHTQIDQRAFKRMDHNCPVEVSVYWPQDNAYPGRIHNLTPGGVMITLEHQLLTEQVIKLCSSSLDAVARVVSCNHDMKRQDYMLGLEFITLRINRAKGIFISESA
jgi:hypothetical protein